MIDSKIIGMSELKKYGGKEVFRHITVKQMAGIESYYSHRISNTKITPLDDAKMMKTYKIKVQLNSVPSLSLP